MAERGIWKRVLVTGGAGFIGSNFARYALAQHPETEMIVLDKLTYAGNRENLADIDSNPRFSFVQGDICNRDDVMSAMQGATLVFNFAAETHVDRSIGNPGDFVLTDVYGTYILLQAARELEVNRFVQISTDEVYGEVLGDPVDETAPLIPRNPYAASKAGGDRLAYSFSETYGVPVVITRCSNNFGRNQHPEKLIPLFVTNALEDKQMPVYGSGKNTRDWIHVEDHCAALDMLASTEGVESEVFNIGAENELSVNDIAARIVDILRKPRDLIVQVQDRPAHDRRYALSMKKIRERTGWKPVSDFETALERTVHWYRDNREWWEKIKRGEFAQYYRKHYGLE
jgi:dTDP-glucose 4,6-dehydratase